MYYVRLYINSKIENVILHRTRVTTCLKGLNVCIILYDIITLSFCRNKGTQTRNNLKISLRGNGKIDIHAICK